jgi:hypothetical protein
MQYMDTYTLCFVQALINLTHNLLPCVSRPHRSLYDLLRTARSNHQPIRNASALERGETRQREIEGTRSTSNNFVKQGGAHPLETSKDTQG